MKRFTVLAAALALALSIAPVGAQQSSCQSSCEKISSKTVVKTQECPAAKTKVAKPQITEIKRIVLAAPADSCQEKSSCSSSKAKVVKAKSSCQACDVTVKAESTCASW